jgi:hypothetical protein
MHIEELVKHSYMNFHAKGLHYLCLQRSPLATVKAYFFTHEAASSPEVVIPHNHRYDFVTQVLSGELHDFIYWEVEAGTDKAVIYNKFDFYTPLNGGEGFVWQRPVCLRKAMYNNGTVLVRKGETLFRKASQIHTIKADQGTVLLLTQLADKKIITVPSQAYNPADRPLMPNMSGLYDQMTVDQALGYLDILNDLGVDTNHIEVAN